MEVLLRPTPGAWGDSGGRSWPHPVAQTSGGLPSACQAPSPCPVISGWVLALPGQQGLGLGLLGMQLGL